MSKRAIAPRDLGKIRATNGCTSTAWYYRRARRDEVVVEVKDQFGNYVTTVVVDVPHPRRKSP